MFHHLARTAPWRVEIYEDSRRHGRGVVVVLIVTIAILVAVRFQHFLERSELLELQRRCQY
jgi:hypothetical protein